MPRSKDVRLVVFDLGGVLVRICKTYREGCERAGVPFRGDEVSPEDVARRRAAILEHDLGRIPYDEYCRRVAAAGGIYTPDEVARVHGAWVLGEYEGVGAVLDALARARVDTAVLSNTNDFHWAWMFGTARERFPTLSRVRHPHASHLLGVAKPSEEAYRRIESAAGRRPDEILFFDDLLPNVEGALSRGWDAERIDPHGDPAAQMLTHPRLRGLP
jgi:putative hydrolase of the HAD superfamily